MPQASPNIRKAPRRQMTMAVGRKQSNTESPIRRKMSTVVSNQVGLRLTKMSPPVRRKGTTVNATNQRTLKLTHKLSTAS